MILSPIQNSAVVNIQVRPVITQIFGVNPKVYAQFGLKGHNGVDFRCAVGTPLFAPFEGKIVVKDSGNSGYGLHVFLRKDNLEVVLGHLSKVFIKNGALVRMGDKIALSGNTGFSTGPHLHFGMRYLDQNGNVRDYNNGFFGYVDPSDKLITWKGTFISTNL